MIHLFRKQSAIGSIVPGTQTKSVGSRCPYQISVQRHVLPAAMRTHRNGGDKQKTCLPRPFPSSIQKAPNVASSQSYEGPSSSVTDGGIESSLKSSTSHAQDITRAVLSQRPHISHFVRLMSCKANRKTGHNFILIYVRGPLDKARTPTCLVLTTDIHRGMI